MTYSVDKEFPFLCWWKGVPNRPFFQPPCALLYAINDCIIILCSKIKLLNLLSIIFLGLTAWGYKRSVRPHVKHRAKLCRNTFTAVLGFFNSFCWYPRRPLVTLSSVEKFLVACLPHQPAMDWYFIKGANHLEENEGRFNMAKWKKGLTWNKREWLGVWTPSPARCRQYYLEKSEVKKVLLTQKVSCHGMELEAVKQAESLTHVL